MLQHGLRGALTARTTTRTLYGFRFKFVMLTQVMSPFTPFFTEQMYQNLRRCQPEGAAPESVHWCDFPPTQQPWKGDDQIQRSVARMQTVIELSRTIRYSHHHRIVPG